MHNIPSAPVHCVRCTDVAATAVDGRLLMDERRLACLDEGDLKSRAVAQSFNLVRRVGNGQRRRSTGEGERPSRTGSRSGYLRKVWSNL